MHGGFQLFPERASTFADQVDALLFFLLAVSGFFTVLIAGAIIFFAFRYRRSRVNQHARPAHVSIKLEILWSVGPFLLALVMFGWGATLYFRTQTPPRESIEIYVVGKQWMWKIEHASGRREINELHIPLGQPVTLRLISEDVIHSFFVPAFRVKQDVLPGRYTSLWFQATRPGEYHLFCAEYCGTNHSAMIGRIVVQQPADYQRWLANRADEVPLAVRGEELFHRLRCDSCHTSRDDPRRGPALAGQFGDRIQLADGQMATFDDAYVRESILQPKQKVVAGYEPRMPTYEGQVSETEVLAIAAYLKQLGTSPPPEESMAPDTNASETMP